MSTTTSEHDQEFAVIAGILQKKWPFARNVTVRPVEMDHVVEVDYGGDWFRMDGEGRCWQAADHIRPNLPKRFVEALEELAQRDGDAR